MAVAARMAGLGAPPNNSLTRARTPSRRFYPFDPMTNKVDTGAVSADGSVYLNPQFMTTIVSGGAGNHESEKPYVKVSPSYTGMENYGKPMSRMFCARRLPPHIRHYLSLPMRPQVGAFGRR